MSSDYFVEGDEHQGLTEHGKVDVMDLVEPEADEDEEDELGEEGDDVELHILILHSQVEKIEVDTEVVSDVFPGDMVEVGVLQELLTIQMIEDQGQS